MLRTTIIPQLGFDLLKEAEQLYTDKQKSTQTSFWILTLKLTFQYRTKPSYNYMPFSATYYH